MKLKFTCRSRIKNSVTQKTLSRILAFGILINNIPINSFAGILSEDGRYETFAGNNITVNDVLEEDETDVKVEGNTLVNHIDYSNLFDSRNRNITINQDNKEIFFDDTNNSINTDYTDSALFCKPILKANETYTVIFDIIENTISGEQFFIVLDSYNEYMPIETMAIEDNRTGLVKAKFTVKENNNGTFKIYLRNPNNQQNRGTIKIKNLMILEGDWTNKETPNYFEGIQSSFENNLVTQDMIDSGEEKAENLGKYKVEVKSTGKNKFNGEYINAFIGSNDGITFNTTVKGTKTAILKCNPNDIYTITKKLGNRFVVATSENYPQNNDKVEVHCYVQDLIEYEYTITIPPNHRYLMVYVQNETDNSQVQMQIEEGTTATEYEPYKESINTFYLNSPLLKGDTIEFRNGQAYHIKNSEVVVLNENNNIRRNPINKELYPDKYRWIIYSNEKVANIPATELYLICDKYKSLQAQDTFLAVDGISQNNVGNQILLYLEKYSDGSDISKQLLIDELNDKKIKILYQLSEPIYEPIKADLSVQLFEGTTYISNNSNIPATMEITIDRTINRAVEAIELAKVNPTIENISLARMWTNLLKETINKDNLQGEINNITEVKDLEIEKKSVSANVDVYVKSDNALSMTLSTNSIMFDNYSGVSDMEKLNAVEVTVHSSLPYDLNAYLESGITSSDNTTMNSNLLQIKQSENSTYQSFINTTNKIILKEDCESGNYNKHNIDLKMEGSNAYKADVYKTVIKFEAEQK